MSVWMKHPQLPEDQLIEVHDDTVAAHHRSGWEVTDPPPPTPNAGDLEAAAAENAARAEAETKPKSGTKSKSGSDRNAAAVDERPDESTPAQDGKE